MERQRSRLRHWDPSLVAGNIYDSLDDPSPADPILVITPPEDFQDMNVKNGAELVPILEPPAMFRPGACVRHQSANVSRTERPKTDMFWATERSSTVVATSSSRVDQGAHRNFDDELERLKSHSLFLRFPLDGSSRVVQYRSSHSIVNVPSFRLRTEEETSTDDDYRSTVYAVSETESEEEDEDDAAVKETQRRRTTSTAARLSTSSGPSASSEADADSGIDGVSPRVSAGAFGESTLSPSQSILYIDSLSLRNSVLLPPTEPPPPIPKDEKEDVEEGGQTNEEPIAATELTPALALLSSAAIDEGIGPRASVLVAEGDPRRDRSHRVALELLTTERTYVDVLHLLDQVFQFRIDQENRAHNLFPQDLIPQMFSNIKSLYKLHSDFFLPRLEERLREWEDQTSQERRIGDIMTSFAPFLKMYAEYVRNFDHATHLIASMTAKSPKFAAIVDEIQQLPQCGQLSLQHHMLTPIQRVPRYEMLLRDYLRRLPDDSADRLETEKALHLVSTAANHANEAMKKIDQFKQLLEIQESLGGVVDLVSPTRELLKEGKIVKISARSGDHQERYLFLFTDLLLLCSPVRLITNRVMSGGSLTPYRVRARFNIAQVEVLEGDNLETANTFYLREGEKTVELYTATREEKEAWIDALFAAMTELTRRKSSLRISPGHQQSPTKAMAAAYLAGSPETANHCLMGKTAPELVRMDSVSRCMHCQSQFSVMRRKHHCHCCGKVTCNRCSSRKVQLPYESAKPLRVCEPCHHMLTTFTITAQHNFHNKLQNGSPLSSPESPLPSPPSLRSGLLEVSVDKASVHSGYLSLKTRGKTWQKRWFALRSDFVLYSYRSDQGEDRAMTATPVPGFSVTLLSGSTGQLNDGASPSHQPLNKSGSSASSIGDGMISERDRSFKMSHVHKSYHFQATSRQEAERWVLYLQMAARADLPIPT